MFNFVRVVTPNVRQCFQKLEHRIHLCSTLKVPNITAADVGSEARKESYEFDIFEIKRVHNQPFHSLKQSILNDITTLNNPFNKPLVNDRVIAVMEQENILSWEYIRPLKLIGSCEILARSRGHTITDEEWLDIYRLGWIYQMFEIYQLMVDDISDNCVLRSGRPSWWYKNNKNPVGLLDNWMLLSCYRILMHTYFKDKFYYKNIQKIMNEAVLLYAYGENLFLITENIEFLKTVTMEDYQHIVAYKGGYHYHVPLNLALHINGLYDEEDAEKIYKISSIAGAHFQFWDDFIDREKDLAGGLCSWMPVLAFQKANESQKKTILDNFCKNDQKSINAMLKVYEEMDMKTLVADQRKKFQLAVETESQTLKNQDVAKILINMSETVGEYHTNP